MTVYLDDLVDLAELGECIELGLINVRTSPDHPYRIFNYTNKAMFTPGAWDYEAVRVCRGLIVDSSNKVIARPWRKFFNHNQPEAGELDMEAPVEVTDKADGSLGILFLDPQGQVTVATRGSFTSDQAVWATQWVRENDVVPYPDNLRHVTLLVEIVYSENRIVLDYGDFEGLILLGGVDIETGEYLGPGELFYNWAGAITETFRHRTLKEALAAPPRPNAEGLCVRYLDRPRIVKVKYDDYLRLHRIVFGLSRRSVWEWVYNSENPAKATFEEFAADLPDEFLGWAKEVWAEIYEKVDNLCSGAFMRLELVQMKLPIDASRKEIAEKILTEENKIYAPLMFARLDGGRDIFRMAMKYIKPEFSGADRAIVVDESVA